MAMESATIHRARLRTRAAGARNAQGEKVTAEPVAGPWFRARIMLRGAVADKRRRGESSTDARVARPYEILAGPTAEDGSDVVLTASCEVETECEILGNPVIELSGEPELLNNGVEKIGWMAYGDVVKDRA